MDIYWIKDKRQCGPATVPDIISQLQMGELTPETLGWHTGCKKWLPLRELPALADFLNKEVATQAEGETAEAPSPQHDEEPAPAPAESAESDEVTQANTSPPAPGSINGDNPLRDYVSRRVYLPNPVARLLARFVDYGLYAVLYGGIVALRGLPYDASLLLSVNPLLWLPMLLLEAWMLSTWGTTPGKALMGIRVTTFGEVQRLSYLRALLRAFTVFTLGTGMMLPQLLPIMLVFQYWMLRRRGITLWDARSSTLPTQKEPLTPSRYVLAVISLYVSAVLFISSMKPWLPAMLDDIGRQNPEMAQSLRKFMPEAPPTPAPATTATAPTAAKPAAPVHQDTTLPGI